jgi:glucose/arabinose dehydrogenase
MVWQNTSTGDRSIWLMNGASWDGSYASLPQVPTAWSIAASGDFNADGQADIVWQNTTTGDRSIWFMSGTTWGGTYALLPQVSTQWSIAGVGDFNADGKPDIVWQNTSTGDRSIWFMSGSTWNGSYALLPQVSTEWSIAAVGDFNADGKPDLVWQNTTTGQRSIWFMDGSAWNGEYALLPTVSTAWSIAAAADFDGDSKTDLVWQNTNSGDRSVWWMNGSVWAGDYALLPNVSTDWSIAAVMPASGGGAPPGSLTLRLAPFVTTGLSAPLFFAAPLNDGRVFIVEQGGRIRVVRNGVLQTTPFLDISTRVLSGGERGLLSVAFHPQYATNRYFYVYFTTQTNGDIRIERFTTTSDPDVADPTTSKLIITAPHSTYVNHNGGLLAFGPDGMLYAGLGDGGGGGDPLGNGQNFNSLLGSLLRLDVDHGDPYAIPADNPFVGQANRKGELWAKGLRNPWRYAFDRITGRLYIADVGQDAFEEIDVAPANMGGINYGWNIMEGFSCWNATTCTQTGLQLPVLDYSHSNGCSITGGYVYRGSAIPEINGNYFYADYCSGWLKSFRYDDGVLSNQKDWGLSTAAVKSFGVDLAGELYVVSSNSVYKIVRGP